MPNTPLSLFVDHPTVLRVDDRQRLARERREEREKQLGKAPSDFCLFVFNELPSSCSIIDNLFLGVVRKIVLDLQ